MNNKLEAPWIGQGPPDPEPGPFCPYCGRDPELFYYRDGECVGCEGCLKEVFYEDV